MFLAYRQARKSYGYDMSHIIWFICNVYIAIIIEKVLSLFKQIINKLNLVNNLPVSPRDNSESSSLVLLFSIEMRWLLTIGSSFLNHAMCTWSNRHWYSHEIENDEPMFAQWKCGLTLTNGVIITFKICTCLIIELFSAWQV